jgi:pimeloyl-ACP methyl ester carboxylesterase
MEATGANRFMLVGHSLGGMLAMEWLGRYPDEVVGVATLNSSSGHLLRGPFGRLNQLKAMRMLPQFFRTKKDASKYIRWLTDHRDENEEKNNQDEWQALLDDGSRGFGLVMRQFLCVAGWLPRIDAAYHKRILLTVGSGDSFVPASATRRLKRQLPGASVVRLPGGHELFADQGPELAKTIIEHFESLCVSEE